MTTFFNRVDKYEPSIMVIRTTDMEVGQLTFLSWIFYFISFKSNVCCPFLLNLYIKVFGAYCSASWAERNQKDDKG